MMRLEHISPFETERLGVLKLNTSRAAAGNSWWLDGPLNTRNLKVRWIRIVAHNKRRDCTRNE